MITLRQNTLNMKVLKRIYKYIAIISLFFSISQLSANAHIPSPKHEVRAVWLTTIGGLDWPHSYARSENSVKIQKKELCDILDKLKKANINTVLLQTRIRGTVIYPSAYEPWDGSMSGIPGLSPGYDPLAFAIDECHKRGMELHAWVVTIPIGRWNNTGCKKLRYKYPNMIKRIGDEGYINPEHPQAGPYIADICGEITENYDIDGIHLDYIRYPETWNRKINRRQGREYITGIVKMIHNRVKGRKPWVKISCSPIGKFDDLTRYRSHGWNAYTTVCQDAQGWLQDGFMDELFPMIYFKGNQFYPFALDWKENSNGRIICAGLGIYFMSDKEKDWDVELFKRKMNVLRANGMGHAFFRSRFFTENIKGIYDLTSDEIDKNPALIPPMTWQWNVKPSAPSSMTITNTKTGYLICWNGAKDMSDGTYLSYNIYSSPSYPVDIDDARNIIATRYLKQEIFIANERNKRPRYYAVTAMDRYGNESQPISIPPKTIKENRSSLLKNDGRILSIPPKTNILSADYLIIETLQGGIVATRPYIDETADISNLSEGMYVLRSLGQKGITHRLGTFIIKRH